MSQQKEETQVPSQEHTVLPHSHLTLSANEIKAGHERRVNEDGEGFMSL